MKKSATIDFGNEVYVSIEKDKVLVYGEDRDTRYTFELQEIRDIYEILISFEDENNQRMV